MSKPAGRRSGGRHLRLQVAAALAVCVALFGLAAWALTARAYHEDRAAAGRQLARLAGAAGADLAAGVAEADRILAGLAGQEAIASFDPARCQPVLSGFSGIGTGHLVLIDPGGTVRCSSLPGGGGQGSRAYADAPWLAGARQGGAAVRTRIVDPLTGQLRLLLAVPVPGANPDRPPGVLGAVLRLEALAGDLIGPVEQARGTTITVFDSDRRTVLFQSSRAELGSAPAGRLPVGGLFEATGADGVRRVYHPTTVPELGWHLYAASPASVVFAPARHTVDQSVTLAAVVLGLLGALTVFLFRAVGAAQSERVRELGEARAELQRALVRFTQVMEEERRLIAQALHDQTIQALLATMWALEDLQTDHGEVPAGNGRASTEVLNRIQTNLETAVSAARSMLTDLRPPALDELGVVAAVEQELQRVSDDAGLAVSFEGGVGGRLPAPVETLAFRIIQEALRNVRHHARATSVQVRVERRDDVLYGEVLDDGIGLDPAVLSADTRPHAGIVAMRENVVMGGGSFSIGPGPGRGTAVQFSLPVELPAVPA